MSGTKNLFINRKNGPLLKFFIGVAALLFFLIILNLFSSMIRNAFYVFSYPVERAFWSAGETASSYVGSFLKAGFLAKENENLKNENQKLLAKIVALQALADANQSQNAVSLACQNNDFKLLMAGIAGLNGDSTLSINKGSADGIAENMPVIDQEGALFGKVFKVYKNYSQVMLISNKNSVIDAKVQSIDEKEKGVNGVLKGNGGLDVVLDLVPVDDALNEGDILVTSSLEGTFPKGLLVGRITKVEKNDQSPHQRAQVQPFFNITADNLFVITNYKE